MFGLFIANANGAQAPQQTKFDLPDDTPGLMIDKQNQSVCGKMKECVHVVVPKTDAERALKREYYDDVIEATANNGNIYFPADGTQPTTEEAGRYSCANVDAYNENSPITEWYMKMFGVIDKNGKNSNNEDYYIKAGYAFKNIGRELLKNISLDVNIKFVNFLVKNYNKCDCYAQHIRIINFENDLTLKDNFQKAFIKIASDPVGRVLLYRLLIEIRRFNVSQYGTYGNMEYDLSNLGEANKVNLIRRNFCRPIDVNKGKFDFVQSKRTVHFSSDNVKLNILSMNRSCTQVTTASEDTPADVCLFHEMIHWFQLLRNIFRTDNEYDYENKDHFISSCYGEDESIKTWGGAITLTEIRTILGGPNYQNKTIRELMHESTFYSKDNKCNSRILVAKNQYIVKEGKYLHGDDISENAYRMLKTINPTSNVIYPMRWGHTNYKMQIVSISGKHKLANAIARFCYSDICNDQSLLDKWCLVNSDGKRGTAVSGKK